jgi:hypothetical protein
MSDRIHTSRTAGASLAEKGRLAGRAALDERERQWGCFT